MLFTNAYDHAETFRTQRPHPGQPRRSLGPIGQQVLVLLKENRVFRWMLRQMERERNTQLYQPRGRPRYDF